MQKIKEWVGKIAEKLIVAGLNYITNDGYKTVFKDQSLEEVMALVDNYLTAVDESKKFVEIEKLKTAKLDLTPRDDEENDPLIYEEQDIYIDLCAALKKVIQKGDRNDQRSLKVNPTDNIVNVKLRSLDFDNGIGVVDFTKNEEKYSASFYFPLASTKEPNTEKLVDMILKLKANRYVVDEASAKRVIRTFCNSITRVKRIKSLKVEVKDENERVVDQTTHVLKATTRNNSQNKNIYLIQTVVNPDTENAEIFQYQIASELPISKNEKRYSEMIGYALSQYYQGKANNLLTDANVESYTAVDLQALYDKNRQVEEKKKIKEKAHKKAKMVMAMLGKGKKQTEKQLSDTEMTE